MAKRAVISMAIVLQCSLLWAGEYKGDGYSITVPEGWAIFDKEGKLASDDTVSAVLKSDQQIDAVLYSPDRLSSVIVLTGRESVEISQEALPAAVDTFRAGAIARGMKLRVSDSSIVQIDGRSYVLIRGDVSRANSLPARLWTLVGRAGGRTFAFMLGTASRDPSDLEPVFARMVLSVRLQGGILGWYWGLPAGWRYGLIGGIVVAVVIAARLLLNRRTTSRAQTEVAPEPWPHRAV